MGSFWRLAGLGCPHAHGIGELRREAAIQLGLLPSSYKTSLCRQDYEQGYCSMVSEAGWGGEGVLSTVSSTLRRVPAAW